MKNELIFDVETKQLFADIGSEDPRQLGLSLVSVYRRTVDNAGNEVNGQMISLWEREIGELWNLFRHADRIIGFNTKHFDIPVLSAYTDENLMTLPHFDIFETVRNSTGKKLPLDLLARDTIGVEKTDIGTNAVRYYKLGDDESLRKLRMYCEADVDITKRLYDFGRRYSFLRYKDKWNNLQKVEIDFSYPLPPTSGQRQIGLF